MRVPYLKRVLGVFIASTLIGVLVGVLEGSPERALYCGGLCCLLLPDEPDTLSRLL